MACAYRSIIHPLLLLQRIIIWNMSLIEIQSEVVNMNRLVDAVFDECYKQFKIYICQYFQNVSIFNPFS